jgi:hypothetical protein
VAGECLRGVEPAFGRSQHLDRAQWESSILPELLGCSSIVGLDEGLMALRMTRLLVNARRDKSAYRCMNFVVVEITYGRLNFPLAWC